MQALGRETLKNLRLQKEIQALLEEKEELMKQLKGHKHHWVASPRFYVW
jgi:hypothetical protein